MVKRALGDRPGASQDRDPARPVRLRLLGGFSLFAGDAAVRLPPSAERLLAFLALHDRALLRPYVAGSLWPETTEQHAGGDLRSVLWKLNRCRQALVDIEGGRLELAPFVLVDYPQAIAIARRLLDGTALRPGDLDCDSLAEDLLPDWNDEWVAAKRDQFRQLRLHALDKLSERLTGLGRFAQAVEAGLAAVACEPLRESAHRSVIKAHLAEGNVGEAILQYRALDRLLAHELHVRASKETAMLIDAVSPSPGEVAR